MWQIFLLSALADISEAIFTFGPCWHFEALGLHLLLQAIVKFSVKCHSEALLVLQGLAALGHALIQRRVRLPFLKI